MGCWDVAIGDARARATRGGANLLLGRRRDKTNFLVIHLTTALPASMVRPSSWLQARTRESFMTVLGPGSDSSRRFHTTPSTRTAKTGEYQYTRGLHSLLLLRRPLPPPLRHRRPVVKMPRHRRREVLRSDRQQRGVAARPTLVVREGPVGDAFGRVPPEGPVPSSYWGTSFPGAM